VFAKFAATIGAWDPVLKEDHSSAESVEAILSLMIVNGMAHTTPLLLFKAKYKIGIQTPALGGAISCLRPASSLA